MTNRLGKTVKLNTITGAVLSALMLTSACASNAGQTPIRHQAVVGDSTVVATNTGVYYGEQQLVEGDFFHLKALQLTSGATVFAAVEGNDQQLHLWQAKDGKAEPLWQGEITTRVVEDLCFYESRENRQLSVFLLGGRGGAEQRLLQQDGQWLPQPLTIRAMNVPFDSTACAVSQEQGKLYVAEADQAIWAYNAEPEVDEGRDLIAAKAPFGDIQAELKALELMSDGSLLALEEEAPRLLLYRADDNGYQFERAMSFDGINALTDISLTADGDVLLTEENLNAMQTVQIDVAAATEPRSQQPVAQVAATLETQPSPRRGDAIDDPAVWVHPNKPAASRILGTDKRTGLYVYDMQGNIVQELAVGRLNNVDVRGNLAAATLRDDNSIQLFSISDDGVLTPAANQTTDIEEIYGLCMGYDSNTEQASVYINGKSGRIQHYLVNADGSLQLAREMQVPTQPEGCVVDDASQRLFVGEEDVAVWLFDAKPDGGSDGDIVIRVADHPQLVDDIEGLAFARINGEPMLFVSSQGNDSYMVFDAQAPWAQRAHYRIRTNIELGLDGASETDGIEVTTHSLGAGFEQGAFIVQDGRNRMPEAGQNLKLVPLQAIIDLL
ncbi:3-phytase [Idiomarina aquatica]|uniref:3-phytase n=1 Tax=Idiomarina aquatica TaxID=1327752 RepID=A0AA94EGD8_9GAMM|nr:3-phytase [Idiomarina aquatica]